MTGINPVPDAILNCGQSSKMGDILSPSLIISLLILGISPLAVKKKSILSGQKPAKEKWNLRVERLCLKPMRVLQAAPVLTCRVFETGLG